MRVKIKSISSVLVIVMVFSVFSFVGLDKTVYAGEMGTVAPNSATLDKYQSSADYKDVVVNLNTAGYAFYNIILGSKAVCNDINNSYNDENFSITGDNVEFEITLKKEWIAQNCDIGENIIVFSDSPGIGSSYTTFTLNVSDSTPSFKWTVGNEHTKGNSWGLEGALINDRVSHVQLDGNVLDEPDIMYTNNKAQFMIGASFLDSLSIGDHKVVIQTTGGNKFNTSINIKDKYGLNPVVEPTKVTIKFNAKGGKIKGNKSKTVTKGNKYGKLPKATKKGYNFKGWYTKSGKKVTASKKPTKSITLYAKWKKNGKVTPKKSVWMRTKASASAKKIKYLKKNTKVCIVGKKGKWWPAPNVWSKF